MTLLHSWGFLFSIIFFQNFYGRSSEVVGGLSLTVNFRARCWNLPSTRYYWRSPLLLPDFWYPTFHLPAVSLGYLFLVLPDFSGGLQSSWKDCFTLVSDSPGSLLPSFCYCRSLKKKFLTAASLLSYTFFWVAVFPHVLWGGEDKIEVIEEIVSNVIRIFYYRLILSRSDFAKRRPCYLWLFYITSISIV